MERRPSEEEKRSKTGERRGKESFSVDTERKSCMQLVHLQLTIPKGFPP